MEGAGDLLMINHSSSPAPSQLWTRRRIPHLGAEPSSAGKNNGGKRGENKNHTLHGEKTPLVKLVWSPPIPLAMEERCPLRSFQC